MRLLPLLLWLVAISASAQVRINHEGRILGLLPTVTQPLLFNTPEADAVVSAMQVMPVDSVWNENISQRPLLPNSAAMIAQIRADLPSSRQTLRPFFEMNYVLVPENQPTQPIRFFNYPDESELDGGTSPVALYPIPSNMPVELWPRETGSLTLEQWQRDVNQTGGDRHSIIVKPGSGVIWETWLTRLLSTGWEASNGARFSLNNNNLRPGGWTSADAAGLPMFPALVRYDECQRGVVEHALRLIVKRTRLGPIYPATHAASVPSTNDPNVPAMGQRLRLRASYAIPANWTKEEKAVLVALKKYGAIVADNGGFFSISVAPDNRFPVGVFDRLATVPISEFEVVSTTGANEGPRSAGAPMVQASAAASLLFGSTAALSATRTGNGTILWRKVEGPGAVNFANAAALNTTATFSEPGRYTLMVSVDNGVHAVAYSAVIIDVTMAAAVSRNGSTMVVTFPTVAGQNYRVESRDDLTSGTWQIVADNLLGNGAVREFSQSNVLGLPSRFYRVSVLPQSAPAIPAPRAGVAQVRQRK